MRMKLRFDATIIINFVLFVVTLLSFSARAEDYVGRVVRVLDGDTITLVPTGKRQIKVRLAEIDAPEPEQPYGTEAKQELSSLVLGKTISVKFQDTDRYAVIVGRVYVDTHDVNADMVRRGAAWVYSKYATDQGLYALEDQARKSKSGLWFLPETVQVPPWEWRRGKRSNPELGFNRPELGDSAEQRGFSCGRKTTCGEMTSCAEAYFYLNKCGIGRLDHDKNGIPCESVCR